MVSVNVATNFDLLRSRYGTHKALHQRLQTIVTWHQLSAYTLGQKEAPDETLQAIEAELKLPANWFRRDNATTLTISQDTHTALGIHLKISERERKAINALLSALNAASE